MSRCFSQYLVTYAHHGARSVKELRITIHVGDLFWERSKCSELGHTCLLKSAGISDLSTPSEFMHLDVIHQFSFLIHEVTAQPFFLLRKIKLSAKVTTSHKTNSGWIQDRLSIQRLIFHNDNCCACIETVLKLLSFGY